MKLFSERYGYTKPSDVIIREKITPEIQNAICSCYDKLKNRFFLDSGLYFDTDPVSYTHLRELRSSPLVSSGFSSMMKPSASSFTPKLYMVATFSRCASGNTAICRLNSA